jgi:hypothetical protein
MAAGLIKEKLWRARWPELSLVQGSSYLLRLVRQPRLRNVLDKIAIRTGLHRRRGAISNCFTLSRPQQQCYPPQGHPRQGSQQQLFYPQQDCPRQGYQPPIYPQQIYPQQAYITRPVCVSLT